MSAKTSEEARERFKRLKAFKGFTVTGVVFVAVAVLTVLAFLVSTVIPAATPNPSPTASATPDSGKAKASSLVVTPADLLKAHYKPALCTSDAYLPYSLATTPGRVVTLGPSIPFASSDPSQILPQKFAHNCGDPTEVDMDIQMWKKVNVDGHNVYAANASWMDTCEATADKKGLRAGFLTFEPKHGTDEFVTKQYTVCAELDNALWLGLGVPVVAPDKSLYNWYIPVQVSGELPRVALDPVPDTLAVAKFTVNDKTRKCVVAVGINPLDGRDEILPCTTTPPACVGTSCTTHPGCTGSTCHPPVKTCLSVYGSKYPHGTYPVCKDDSGNGPSHHGNDGGNGGPNQNPGLDPTNTPTPVPSAPHTNPPSPKPTSPPTGSTPAPTVTATPTPEGGDPDAPQ